MPATINKQKLLTLLLSSAKKTQPAEAESRPVMEQFLYGICREGVTREQADRAFHSLRASFFDWNEVRVSSVHEVEEAIKELPGAEQRAQRILSFLQEVFETTFSFDLDGLHKKGLKQAAKALSRFQAANDYVGAWVIQQALGGHAIPLDEPTLRTARRTGLIDGDQDGSEAVRASLEHHVPKAKGALFVELIAEVARDYCFEDNPNCPGCPLRTECATGQEFAPAGGSARSARPKPR